MLNDSGDGLRIAALFCLCICKASVILMLTWRVSSDVFYKQCVCSFIFSILNQVCGMNTHYIDIIKTWNE